MSIATFYRGDPKNAPKTTQGAHLGANAMITCRGKLLLERRTDCGKWGLVGGRLKKGERYTAGIAREVREETGLVLAEHEFRQLRVCDDARIAAYRDGTVWRMVIVLFSAVLREEPSLQCSRESKELRFFRPAELDLEDVVVTHRDLVAAWIEENRSDA